jgi:hypothetical protein
MDNWLPPLTWSVLSFLLGIVFGHWLSVHRDQRKEFNEVADRLAIPLETQGRAPDPYFDPPWDDLGLLRRHLRWWPRARYDAALDNYEKATGKDNRVQDEYGKPFYVDGDKVKKATERLCKFLHRR